MTGFSYIKSKNKGTSAAIGMYRLPDYAKVEVPKKVGCIKLFWLSRVDFENFGHFCPKTKNLRWYANLRQIEKWTSRRIHKFRAKTECFCMGYGTLITDPGLVFSQRSL